MGLLRGPVRPVWWRPSAETRCSGCDGTSRRSGKRDGQDQSLEPGSRSLARAVLSDFPRSSEAHSRRLPASDSHPEFARVLACFSISAAKPPTSIGGDCRRRITAIAWFISAICALFPETGHRNRLSSCHITTHTPCRWGSAPSVRPLLN